MYFGGIQQQFGFMGMGGMYGMSGMNMWGGFPGIFGGFGGMRQYSKMFSPWGTQSNNYSQSYSPGKFSQSGSSSYVPNLQIGQSGYGRETSWSRSQSSTGTYGPFSGSYSNTNSGSYSDTLYQYDKQKAVDYKFESQLGRRVVRRDPVILDLNGDGKLDVTGRGGSKINYDVNGDGITDRTEWMKKGSQDGLLAYDANHDGKITGNELMNETSIDGKQNTYKSGWDKMLALGDKNKDGKLTGDELKGFSVWTDKDGDGITDAGELQSAAKTGLVEIDSKEGSFTRRRQVAHESSSYSNTQKGGYDMFGNTWNKSSSSNAYSRSNPWSSYSHSDSRSYSGGSNMFGNVWGKSSGATATSWRNPFGSFSFANAGSARHMNGWWF